MPHVNTVTTTYERKVQLEQYEPVTHRVELEVAVEDDDDPDEVYDEYSDRAEDMVERALVRRMQQKALAEDAEDDD